MSKLQFNQNLKGKENCRMVKKENKNEYIFMDPVVITGCNFIVYVYFR